MKKLSKMVNFRTTPERYEQIKQLADQMPYPKTVAHVLTRGLALVEEQIAARSKPLDHVAQEIIKCVGKKSTRPAAGRKTRPGRPTKRKT